MADDDKSTPKPNETIILREPSGELLRKGGLNLRPVTPPPPDPSPFRPQDSGSSTEQEGGSNAQEPKE